MIELTPSAALVLYLGMTLLPLLILWVLREAALRKKKINPPEKELYVCEYCHFAYLEDQLKSINRCPQCASYNRRKKI